MSSRFMLKFQLLGATLAGATLVFGSCVTSGQLYDFGRNQVTLAISSFFGQIVAQVLRGAGGA